MPMHRVPAIALIAAFLVLAGCVHVTTDWNPKADFSSLSTYSFTSPPAETPLMNSLYNDELYRERVRSAIESDLKSKGYRLAGEGEVPTFRIAFFRVVDKKLTHSSVSTYMGYSSSNWYGGANYGADLGGDPVFGTSTVVSSYTQATLLIDVQNPKGSLMWRGTGATRLTDPKAPDEQQQAIDKEVTTIMQKFPPGATSA